MLNRNNTICFLNLIGYILEDFHKMIKNNKTCEGVIFKFKHFYHTLHVYSHVFQGTTASDVWKLWQEFTFLSISTRRGSKSLQFFKKKSFILKIKSLQASSQLFLSLVSLVLLSPLSVSGQVRRVMRRGRCPKLQPWVSQVRLNPEVWGWPSHHEMTELGLAIKAFNFKTRFSMYRILF